MMLVKHEPSLAAFWPVGQEPALILTCRRTYTAF
jgi:hypothetical protein